MTQKHSENVYKYDGALLFHTLTGEYSLVIDDNGFTFRVLFPDGDLMVYEKYELPYWFTIIQSAPNDA